MPEPRADSLTLLQVTDCHLSASPEARMLGITTEDSFRAVLALAAAEGIRPDALLLTGDLSQDGSAAAYQRLLGAAEAFGVPLLACPGNHDDPAVLGAALAARGHPALAEDHDGPGWTVIRLDSTIPGRDEGWLADAELARLRAALDRCLARGRRALVALHHPPILTDTPWLDTMVVGNASALAEVLGGPERCALVVCGHVHQALEGSLAGVPVWTTPSTCFQFARGAPTFAADPVPPGCRWLHLPAVGAPTTRVARLPELPPGFDPAAPAYGS